MRKFVFVAAVTTVLALFNGCSKTSTELSSKTSVEGSGGKKMTLVQPADQTVKRGSFTEVTVKISREKFSEPVSDKADIVSNQNVKVSVSGPDGMKATEAFKLTVKDKD
jgi:hypothetical protein